MDNRKRYECPEKDYVVESTDENEIIRGVKMHGREKHNQEMSDEDIRAGMK